MSWILSAFADEAGRDIDTQIAALRDARVAFVDLRAVGEHTITDLPVDDAKKVAEKLADAGIAVGMFGSPIGKIDIADDFAVDLERIAHLERLAPIFGASSVRIFSYYNKAGAPKDAWRAESLNRLTELRSRAGDLGLVLYHENESHIFGDHPLDVLTIAELRDGTTFRTVYDFSNYLRTGVGGRQTWQMLRDVTDAFHFKDQLSSGEVVPIGQGDTDAEWIVADALANGWSGPCTVEPHLVHSDAVLATIVSGKENAALKDLGPLECFRIACREAHAFLARIGVEYR